MAESSVRFIFVTVYVCRYYDNHCKMKYLYIKTSAEPVIMEKVLGT